MKLNRTTLMVLLAGGLAMGTWVNAADAPAAKAAQKSDAKAAPGSRPAMRDRTTILAERLQLNEEQKQKVKPILEEEMTKLREVWQDKNGSREDKMKKMQEVREATKGKLKPILTTEQWEKYEKMYGVRPGQPKAKQ